MTRRLGILATLLIAVSTLGCQKSEPAGSAAAPAANTAGGHDHDHDHEETPATYGAALAEVDEHLQVIQAAFAAGKPSDCDDALHHLAPIAEGLPKLAESAGIVDPGLGEVKTASKQLFDALVKIHEGFHGDGKGMTYDEVKTDIESAVGTLRNQLEIVAAPTPGE